MDESTGYEETEHTQPARSCCEELKEYVQENPTRVLLAGVGVGLLLALALRPRKPARSEHRAVRILEDIQHRLKDIAEPAYHRAVSAADRGAAAVKEGVEHLEDLDIPGTLCGLKRKLLQFFR